MHIVAIHNLPEKKEALAQALATALGVTVYEALSRLKCPGKGPFIVALCTTISSAEELLKKLSTRGFDAILLHEDEIENESAQFAVRRFRIGDDALIVESRTGESIKIDYRDIDLFLRGTSITLAGVKETVTEKKFNFGMTLMTSGLKMSKTREKILESTTQTREGFFLLYRRDGQTLIFRESGLVYDSLGAALQPTRQGNFSCLVEELRQHGTEALYDDRMLSRARQVQLLGPLLNPEKYLAAATSLLAMLLRAHRVIGRTSSLP